MIWEGFIWGLTLTVLIGPIFIALIQTGIEHGFRAGVSVGLGIWSSDILIIYVLIALMTGVKDPLIVDHNMQHYGGIIGGIILMLFGLGSLLKKKLPDLKAKAFSAKNFAQLYTKGFIVNTVNPFTFVFWISLITAYNLGKNINHHQSLVFYGSILFTIMCTDTIKVFLSKKIRSKLTPHNVLLISKIAGAILIIFGLSLILRTW